MGKKRQSSFNSDTSLTTSGSECLSGYESSQLLHSNTCSQSSPLSNVFKKFKLSSESIHGTGIALQNQCEDINNVLDKSEKQDFVRCSTPIYHNSFNDSIERHFSQFNEEDGMLLFNSSDENIENKNIKELSYTEIILKNTLQCWKKMEYSNLQDNNDGAICITATDSKDNNNDNEYNKSLEELFEKDGSVPDLNSYNIKALTKSASKTQIRAENVSDDSSGILETAPNAKSFNINEEELVEHFSNSQLNLVENVSDESSEVLLEKSHTPSTLSLNINEAELGKHFSQLQSSAVESLVSTENGNSLDVSEKSVENVSHHQDTMSINEEEIGKHFNQLQNSILELNISLANTKNENVSNESIGILLENVSHTENKFSLTINEDELGKHFNQLENTSTELNLSLINTKHGDVSDESCDVSDNISHIQNVTNFTSKTEELVRHFSHLQNYTDALNMSLTTTKSEDISNKSYVFEIVENVSQIQNTDRFNINGNEIEHFSQSVYYNQLDIPLANSKTEETSDESHETLENISHVKNTSSFKINEEELAKHFNRPKNVSNSELETYLENSKSESTLDELDGPLIDTIVKTQTFLQFPEHEFVQHFSQLQNNSESDFIEMSQENENELNDPSNDLEQLQNLQDEDNEIISYPWNVLRDDEKILTETSENMNEIIFIPNLMSCLEETTFVSNHIEACAQDTRSTRDNSEVVFLIDKINENLQTNHIDSQTAATTVYEEKIELSKSKLQSVLLWFIKQLSENKYPVLKVLKKTWDNCTFTKNLLKLKSHNEVKYSKIKYCTKKGRPKFNLMIHILAKIYLLLLTNSTCTQREVYYQLKSYLKNQAQIAIILNEISFMLNIEIWYLPIMSTSKGLVFGDLTLVNSKEEVIMCNVSRGILIPHDIKNIREFRSCASFVLIVEKDTIFKRLLEEDIPNKLEKPFILITGKGYPDVNTRLLVKNLHVSLKIPIYILVDADPAGIDIMLMYKFGSLNMAHLSEQLAVPSIRWLGIFPSEIEALNITYQVFGKYDKPRIQNMLKRPYINDNPWLKRELEVLEKNHVKAEIEGVIKSKTFFTDAYLASKIFNHDYF